MNDLKNALLHWTVMRLIWVCITDVKIILSGHFQKGSFHLCKPAERVTKSHRNSQILENLKIIYLPINYILKNIFIEF